MIRIDTGNTAPAPSHAKDEFGISFTGRGEHAERKHRQIIEEIEGAEALDDLANIRDAHDVVVDALWMSHPVFAANVDAAYEDHLAMLKGHMAAQKFREESAPGGTGLSPERTAKPMFNIDTNIGGAKGPFLNYKQRAGQGMPDGSWYLREKDGEEWTFTDMTATMEGGIVADIFATHDGQLGGTLQIGYIYFKDSGVDRKFWASPLQKEDRPDESKNNNDGFNWQNLVNFRVALGAGRDALFDVSGWGGYKGVMGLIDQMNGGFAGNVGKCPLVQYTGFRTEGQGTTRLHVPEFKISQWVDRPSCLTPDAPQVAATPAPAPAPDPAPAQSAAPAAPVESAVAQDAGF